uniref:Uncharacterized protein n=1 Tax=Moniliophthora roreri TaxID=221103 RepID=A0A0W0ETV8_MONRR
MSKMEYNEQNRRGLFSAIIKAKMGNNVFCP